MSHVEIPLRHGSNSSRMPAMLALPSTAAGADRVRVPAVLVVHEALGLNEDMRRIAARFAAAGYAALAPDFLAGLGPRPFCLARFMRGIGRPGRGRPYRQLDAARAWLAARPVVDGDRIGVAGFCMGGGLALLWAAGTGHEARAVAPFYAPAPSAADALARVCPVVASYGVRDAIFAPHAARLERLLTETGVEHDVAVYPDAGHSFMSQLDGLTGWLGARLPIHAGYVEPAAEDAWRRVLAFFDRHVAGRPS